MTTYYFMITGKFESDGDTDEAQQELFDELDTGKFQFQIENIEAEDV